MKAPKNISSCAYTLCALLFLLTNNALQGITHTQVNLEQTKTKKILVLIIASDDKPIYVELQKIWRSYMHKDPDHIEAYFIRSNPSLTTTYKVDGDIIWLPSVENLIPGIINKTILALEAFLPRIQQEFDYVLRTNLSSFYVFPRLLDFLEQCPKTNFYGGVKVISGPYTFASGCGFLMSPDVVDLLVKNKAHFLNNTAAHDDGIIGAFLLNNKIPIFNFGHYNYELLDTYKIGDKFNWIRTDWDNKKNSLAEDVFHFRVRGVVEESRLADDLHIHSLLLKMFY